jgi:hypothetical protein
MKPDDKLSFRERSTFMRLGRWLFTWRRLRQVLITLAWIITLVALVYAEENWRGRRAWNQYRQQMQAEGIPLDLKVLIPKPVPDEQNFAMTPSLAPLYEFEPGTQHWRDTNGLAKIQAEPPLYKEASGAVRSEETHNGDWARGVSIDLQEWERAYEPSILASADATTDARAAAAKSVLAGLEEFTPVLNELRAASQRPYSRFNIRYEEENTAGILLPHLATLKRFVQVLKLRASAELALGQTGLALEDIELAFKLSDAVKDEPILISELVRMSEVQLILQPIWEGMAAQKWSDEQLKLLQQKLSSFDFLAEARRGFEADRVGIGNAAIEFVRKSPSKRAEMVGLLDDVGDRAGVLPLAWLSLHVIPSGWFYKEQVEYNRIYDEWVMPLINITNRQVSPELCAKAQQELEKLLAGSPLDLIRHHRIFARMLVPALSGLASKGARAQTATELSATACALERYRLANGRYPDNLGQLVPLFIAAVPNDVIDTKPLRYRQEAGRFVLYSIGWNAKDDQGEYPSKTSSQRSEIRGTAPGALESGDWVWRYPTS